MFVPFQHRLIIHNTFWVLNFYSVCSEFHFDLLSTIYGIYTQNLTCMYNRVVKPLHIFIYIHKDIHEYFEP